MKVVVAITGASGTIYARRLLDQLRQIPQVERIGIVLSENGLSVAQHEVDSTQWLEGAKSELFDNRDFYTPIASGSSNWDAMVVIPCSMGMAARIASGISNDLISRAADVMLKERRRLIIATRETPLSLIHLQNMTTLTQAGAIVMPLCPSFYSKPESVEQITDTLVERVISLLGVEPIQSYRWME